MDESPKTEEVILEAAKKVFTVKGYDGTSMQDIANEAGINKSLLHYYFRTKEKLFHKVFKFVFQLFIPRLGKIFTSDMPFFEKIEAFTEFYINLMIKNPFIPVFVMKEITTHPHRINDVILGSEFDTQEIFNVIEAEIEKGTIEPIDPRHLMVNIIALCVFPVAGRPVIQALIFQNDKKTYREFLEERKKEVPKFVINSIRKR